MHILRENTVYGMGKGIKIRSFKVVAKVKEIYQGWYLSEEGLIYWLVRKRSTQLSQSYYDDNDVRLKWKVYLIPW